MTEEQKKRWDKLVFFSRQTLGSYPDHPALRDPEGEIPVPIGIIVAADDLIRSFAAQAGAATAVIVDLEAQLADLRWTIVEAIFRSVTKRCEETNGPGEGEPGTGSGTESSR